MATKEEKQQLIDTLKFTPRTYRIEMGAYGGEVYTGTVDRKVYDFFKKHRISLDEYASDWDDSKWEFVPEDLRPFSPGSPYDCDNLIHAAGATMDDSNLVTIYDENDEVVWQHVMDPGALEDAGVEINCGDEAYIEQQPEGTVIFWGAQGEKGLCYGGSFELRAPFDPGQLRLTYADCDGWLICNGAEYAGEEICNDDMSTTGKWGENKWIIVGGEEVYEGVDRDDVDAEEEVEEWDAAEALQEIFDEHEIGREPQWDDADKTEWFPVKIKPVHEGVYECQFKKAPAWPWPPTADLTWNGKQWLNDDGDVVKGIKEWRGLREPA